MNLNLARSSLVRIAGAAAVLTSMLTGVDTAQAAPSCAGPGYLCFYDVATQQFGNVSGNNNNWSVLAGGWGDRADYFFNQGRTHHVCVYDGSPSNWSWAGLVLRGATVTHAPWHNRVNSNIWTAGNACGGLR